MAETLLVEDVLRRIKELTGDLEAIRAGISGQVFQPGKSVNCNQFPGANAGREIIAQFQEALDNLRHAVWLYAETMELSASSAPPSQSKLLERATEMLCALSLHPPLPKPLATPCGDSFVTRLLQLMEGPGPKSEGKPPEMCSDSR